MWLRGILWANTKYSLKHDLSDVKKTPPTITTHMNPVCKAWTQGIECLLVALVLTQFSLRTKTVTHDWTHTMILTDRACDLISVSLSHLSISAVFICSVPSWELAASAQQLQGVWSWTKTGCQKTLTQKEKEKKKLRLSAWKWRLLSEHLKKAVGTSEMTKQRL